MGGNPPIRGEWTHVYKSHKKAWAEVMAEEKIERSTLKGVAERWDDVAEFLESDT